MSGITMTFCKECAGLFWKQMIKLYLKVRSSLRRADTANLVVMTVWRAVQTGNLLRKLQIRSGGLERELGLRQHRNGLALGSPPGLGLTLRSVVLT